MSGKQQKSAALWLKLDEKDELYFTVRVNGKWINFFKNKDKKKDEQPDYVQVVNKEKQQEQIRGSNGT